MQAQRRCCDTAAARTHCTAGADAALSRPPRPPAQVRTASCGGTACVNSFGDEQLAVDLLADKLLFEALK